MTPIIHVVSPSLNVDSLKLAIEAQSVNIFNIHKKNIYPYLIHLTRSSKKI
jgi:hypothetical protein